MTRNQLRHLATILLLLGSGCSQLTTTGNSAPPPATPRQELVGEDMETGLPYLHQVQRRGETLILIAKWYTGSGNNWRAIARANPELEPRRIVLGQRIRIPDRLLRTRKMMPADYRLSDNSPKQDQDEVQAPSPPKASGPIDLFGPVDSGKQAGGEEQETKMILETLDE